MSTNSTLLIAEDDDNDLFFLQRAFDAAGLKSPVRIVRDGQEAIDYLSGVGNFADRLKFALPHLLLLDLKMPRKTGMEVLEWLSEQPELHCLPVVVFSSSANRRDVERAYELGANAFVVKPASTVERAELAKAMGLFWLESNQPPVVCTEGPIAARKLRAESVEL
jgi:CheY-like chemotaxis protein